MVWCCEKSVDETIVMLFCRTLACALDMTGCDAFLSHTCVCSGLICLLVDVVAFRQQIGLVVNWTNNRIDRLPA